MCDDAPDGVCATGAFLLGGFSGGMGGFVGMILNHPAFGVFGGVTLGVLAGAYPNGPPRAVLATVVAAAAPAAYASCAIVRTRDAGVLFACAVAHPGARASLALFASGALAAHRRAARGRGGALNGDVGLGTTGYYVFETRAARARSPASRLFRTSSASA